MDSAIVEKAGKTEKDNHTEASSRNTRVDRPSYRRERPAPYHSNMRNVGPRPSNSSRLPPFNRVFVQNIPYEEKWQGLKDLFRTKVGEVTYVELFTDETGKSRGYGIVEFKTKDLCEEAVQKMNRHEINGRRILVKLDYDGENCRKALLRDGHPAAFAMSGMGPPPSMHGLPPPMPGPLGPLPPMPPPMAMGPPSLGLPKLPPIRGDMVPGLNQSGPIGNTVFVANLDYKVTYSKLKEVFQLAGRVVKVDLLLDKDNKSRGMATVTYDDPLDAAQAISMLNNQKLFERTMIVKMDKDNMKEKPGGVGDLPSGLSGIGPALNVRKREPGPGYPGLHSGSIGGFGDSGNGFGSELSGSANLGRFSEIGKSEKLAAGLAALGRLTDSLQTVGSGLDLGSLGALNGLGDLARVGLSGPARNDHIDERLLDERIRLLSRPSNAFSDRERIERDIQRVDSRIRDIDRSLERGRGIGLSKDLPPMPPPMNAIGNNRMQGTSVFITNIPYSLSWQGLRDKFARCGRVLFAEIKTENGKSRGCGSVRFEMPEQAQSAVRHLDGMDIDGRRIIVRMDTKN